MSSDNIFTIGSLTSGSIPAEVKSLAEDLARIHGPVRISSEANGLQIYIPDPDGLREDGIRAIQDPKLAINPELYLGIGRFNVDEYPTKENRQLYRDFRSQGKEVPCAVSMKTKKRWSVSALLTMVPIHKRMPNLNVRSKVTVGTICKDMVYDEDGNLIPNWVGSTIPLWLLPNNHPAIEYLTKRGYDITTLEQQFEACYCDCCLPEDRSRGRYYSKLPGGMRKCHQGRIILTIRMNGVRKGYQSRLIDKVENGNYYVWSDREEWLLIRRMKSDGTVEDIYPPTEEFPKGFEVPKYLNATGSKRNELLMGYDAAVKFNEQRAYKDKYCILCEGPMDAARLGPPAIAILGSSLSDIQADYLRASFGRICTVMDKDAAGKKCLEVINKRLPERVGTDIVLPNGCKDAGDLSPEEAAAINKQCDTLTN